MMLNAVAKGGGTEVEQQQVAAWAQEGSAFPASVRSAAEGAVEERVHHMVGASTSLARSVE